MIPIRTLKAEAQGLTEEQFAALHPEPAFVMNVEPAAESAKAGPESWMKKTLSEQQAYDLGDDDQEKTRQLTRPVIDPGMTPSPEVDLAAAAAKGQVVFVRKGARSLFPDMITIGRVPNNDIVLGFPTISKVHAYLIKKTDGWWLFDQRSTNGSFVQGQRLAENGSARLEDGAGVNLGPSLGLTFMLPGTLYGFMRGPQVPRRRG